MGEGKGEEAVREEVRGWRADEVWIVVAFGRDFEDVFWVGADFLSVPRGWLARVVRRERRPGGGGGGGGRPRAMLWAGMRRSYRTRVGGGGEPRAVL